MYLYIIYYILKNSYYLLFITFGLLNSYIFLYIVNRDFDN
jgi:hypothetical protein